jgi:membrane fusion protein (multidrug efflux system)
VPEKTDQNSNSAADQISSSQPPKTDPADKTDRAGATPEERAHRWRVIGIALVVTVVLVVLALIWYVIFDRGRISTDDAFTDGRSVGIAPKVSGYVMKLAVNDNQFVHAGDLLLQIDPRDYQTAVRQAEAQVAQAQAQLASARLNLQVSRTSQPSDLVTAEAALETARVNYLKAHADLDRQRQVDPRATTQQQTDQVAAQERAAAMQVKEAEARVKTARLAPQNIAIAESQVEGLTAQVTAAQAQLVQSQLNLGYTELRAPQDGRVTKRAVERGDFVQPTQSLMNLVTPEVWITANYKESQLADMRPGQPVTVTVDAYPQLKLTAHVDSVQMGSGSRFTAFPTENATGNFVKVVQRVPVKIVIDGGLPSDWPLPLGLSVNPTVDVRSR